MLNSILMAMFITIIIFITLESFKRDMLMRNILFINEQIKEFISDFLGEIKIFDVFIVKQLRERIQSEFIWQMNIDNFELMMLDSRHLKIAYEIGGTRQEIEISTELDTVELKELGWSYEVEEY